MNVLEVGSTDREPSSVPQPRTLAIVSPHFPPATLAGVHRARHLAKHLPAFGWTPVVIRAHEKHYTERLDPELARLVPQTVEQVRTDAFPAALARAAGVGDIGLRGWNGFRRALDDLARQGRIQAVLITGSPFYPLLLARHVRETLGLPIVLDFQDPWVSTEGAQRKYWSKGRMAHRLALVLEPRAVRHAHFITSVSERQNDEMAARYPWLDRSQMSAIPIGGDPEDFEFLRRNSPASPHLRLDPGKIHLSYVGTFLPRAGALVRVLFQALSDLRVSSPRLVEQMQLHFVGTSNQPSGVGNHLVSPIAASEGVGDLVLEMPHRVPFLEALSLLASSNGLLMIGSDEPHYTASKIYPGLMSGTPFLSLFHSASSAHAILSASGGGIALAFDTHGALEALRSPLADALARLAAEPARLGRANPAAYSEFSAESVARQYAQILDRLLLGR